MTTHILIADDHGIIRDGLRALLKDEPDYRVVGEAATGKEALSLAERLEPDIVLMDISMPGMTGIEAVRELKRRKPQIKVIMLTVHEDQELLREAIQAGAAGFLLKRAVGREMINAIRSVKRGELYVHPIMVRSFFAPCPEPLAVPQPAENLTPREVEVLSLIAQGYTNAQIAEQLMISLRTVEFHRSNMIGKLHVDSRVELVRYAMEHGLVEFNK